MKFKYVVKRIYFRDIYINMMRKKVKLNRLFKKIYFLRLNTKQYCRRTSDVDARINNDGRSRQKIKAVINQSELTIRHRYS